MVQSVGLAEGVGLGLELGLPIGVGKGLRLLGRTVTLTRDHPTKLKPRLRAGTGEGVQAHFLGRTTG